MAFFILLVIMGLVGFPGARAQAFSTGPPDGHAGNPPLNLTCVACHLSFPLTSGDGDLRLLNLPETYLPGQSYDLIVELLDPGQSRWGFELTVLDDANQAGGDLVVTAPDSSQLSDNAGTTPDYIKHTSTGTRPGTAGPRRWPFRWIAPSVPAVTFYFAGNAANNNRFENGDFIYARTERIALTSPVEPSTWGRVKAVWAGAIGRIE
jgi:hypothetical protein